VGEEGIVFVVLGIPDIEVFGSFPPASGEPGCVEIEPEEPEETATGLEKEFAVCRREISSSSAAKRVRNIIIDGEKTCSSV
jgi:hypothetical protein